MATEIEELLVRLQADTANFRAEMKAAVGSVDQATSQMQKDISSFSKESAKNTSFLTQTFSTMTGVLGAKLLTGALSILQSGFAFLSAEFKAGIQDANNQELALTKLASALANTGNYSKDAVDGFAEFADELEATIGVADDAVITVGALIANLSGLSGAPLQEATLAAANLSAALPGVDFTHAGQVVAKAINGNFEALKRYGISIEEGKTSTETLNNVLAALEGRFGGTAEKVAGTFAGSMKLAQAANKNLNEELARSVQGNVTVIAVFQAVAKIFNENTKAAEENRQALREFVGEGVVFVINAMRALVVTIDTVRAVWQALSAIVNTVVDYIQTEINVLISTVTAAGTAMKQLAERDFSGALKTMKDSMVDAGAEVGFFADRTKAEFGHVTDSSESLLKIDNALNSIGTAADIGLEKTRAGAEAIIEPTNNAADSTKKLSDETWKVVEALNKKAEVAALAAEQGITVEAAQAGVDYETQQAALDEALAKNKITQQQYYADIGVLADEYAVKLNDSNQKIVDKEKKRQDERTAAGKLAISDLAAFSNSKNKEVAAVGKAAAIAQATISTYAGATKAFEQTGIYGFITGAAIVAAGLANVAKIAGVGLAGGIDSVPGVGNRDNFPAVLAPGERVVPRETNKDLKQFLDQPQQSVSVSINIQGDFFEGDDANMRLLERIQRGILQTGFKLRTT